MRNTILLTLIMALFVACAVLESKADGVYLGGWSKHANEPELKAAGLQVNQTNWLTVVEQDGWELGHYTNTYYDSTYLAAKYTSLYSAGDWRLGVHIGLTYGYKFCLRPNSRDTQEKVCGVVMPELRYERFKIQPALLFLYDGVAVTFKFDL